VRGGDGVRTCLSLRVPSRFLLLLLRRFSQCCGTIRSSAALPSLPENTQYTFIFSPPLLLLHSTPHSLLSFTNLLYHRSTLKAQSASVVGPSRCFFFFFPPFYSSAIFRVLFSVGGELQSTIVFIIIFVCRGLCSCLPSPIPPSSSLIFCCYFGHCRSRCFSLFVFFFFPPQKKKNTKNRSRHPHTPFSPSLFLLSPLRESYTQKSKQKSVPSVCLQCLLLKKKKKETGVCFHDC
jgi:hypothetical protein